MNSKKISCIFLALTIIFGWNFFLAKRDAELFKAYDHNVQQIK
jgi:hypothetical protein